MAGAEWVLRCSTKCLSTPGQPAESRRVAQADFVSVYNTKLWVPHSAWFSRGAQSMTLATPSIMLRVLRLSRSPLRVVLVLVLVCSGYSFGCECRISGSVSKYLKAADVVFLGKVIFTDDDGSGKFTQQTYVHFSIEESFKGISPEVRDVWADPGSFTSCYAEYRIGERYLVFAYHGKKMPVDTSMETATVTTNRKPLPAGIDRANPPLVYYAPECTGTLPTTPQTQKLLDSWLKQLEAFKRRNGT
jgi:hypothetical protein